MQKRKGMPRVLLPLGFKFQPTDKELVLGYLLPKYRKENLPLEFIRSCDDVYEKPPSVFCTDSTAFFGDDNIAKHYFFTYLNRGKERAARTVDSYGYWHESKKWNIRNNNNDIIGYKKLLNFKRRGEGKKPTDWSMYEFSPCQNEGELNYLDESKNLVLCVIQNKKKEKGTGSCLVLGLDSDSDSGSGSGSGRLEIAGVKSYSVDSGSPMSCFNHPDLFDGIFTDAQFDEEIAEAEGETAELYHHSADHTVPRFDEEIAEAEGEGETAGLYHHSADHTVPRFDEEIAEAEGEGETAGLYHHSADHTVPRLDEEIAEGVFEEDIAGVLERRLAVEPVPQFDEGTVQRMMQQLSSFLSDSTSTANENPCPAQDEETQQSKKMRYNPYLEDELYTSFF